LPAVRPVKVFYTQKPGLISYPIAKTRKNCPEPVMNQETTYLTRLGNALQWRYDGGYLAVFYKLGDEVFGELLFAPSTP
jgi:heat shock protein HslJ